MGLRVVELFAGVGGFHEGLRRAGGYDVVWFNQWEPSTKVQHAYDCYVANFHADSMAPPLSNEDIGKVAAEQIPDHDLLVGGFPCQDYSVAATLDKSKGLQGKKGVLWWEIRRILDAKRPDYVLLENVDRLLKSPASQRGRDFAVLLACLRDLDYVVEWRVLNAADYGGAQRRRRVFVFAAQANTVPADIIVTAAKAPDAFLSAGFFAEEFKATPHAVMEPILPVDLPSDVQAVSDRWAFEFQNAGAMVDSKIWTRRVDAVREPTVTLGQILRPANDESLFVNDEQLGGDRGWRYFKGPKNEERTSKNGHTYRYTEGGMSLFDEPDKPARTLLTGEGGTSPSRSKHLVRDPANGRPRVLSPEECEALNGFPRGWTDSIPARWRYFTMGNALVVDLVERIGGRLNDAISRKEPAESPLAPARRR